MAKRLLCSLEQPLGGFYLPLALGSLVVCHHLEDAASCEIYLDTYLLSSKSPSQDHLLVEAPSGNIYSERGCDE